jgi:dihydrofolate synthase/folylpolyglutamate synthase
LRAAGYRVGTYTSPHVFDIRERIVIDGAPISREAFAEGVAYLRPHIERLADTEYGLTTEFEIKTALAFWAFAQAQVDIAVLEVGVGGRMDATNVITPEASIIVSIGLDHQDRLGPTHRDIAYEKAGIIKPGRPVVSGAAHPDAIEMIARVAEAQGAPLYRVIRAEPDGGAPADDFVYTPLPSPTDSAVRVQRGDWELALQPALIGDYQRHNAACAAGDGDAAARARLRHPRRGDRAGHPRGAPARTAAGGRRVAACGAGRGAQPRRRRCAGARAVPPVQIPAADSGAGHAHPHEPADTLRHLLPLADSAVFTPIDNPRTHAAETLLQSAQEWIASKPTRAPRTLLVAAHPQDAFQRALSLAEPDDLVLITGSFYLVGAWNT